jgi:NTP pyrophosphatase (non-canonical NTP hydrolase)
MRDTHKVMAILQEECAEVIQAVSKIYRFGLNNSWDGITNKQSLVTEIGDVLALIDILVTETDINISEEEIKEAVYNKKEKLKVFLPRYESE